MERLFKQKNIAFSNHIEAGIEIQADPSMIQSVIKNLLINSIKFTPNGGHISSEVSITSDTAVVSIHDNGIGMKPGIIAKLFKQNVEFTTRGTENEKGTGLGLQICKEFIELHGGQIWVESQPAKGTTFYFSLPNPK